MGNLRCKCPMQIQLPVKIRTKPKADVVTVVTRVSTKPGFKCASDAGCFQDGAPRPVPVHKVLFLCACVLVKPMWAAYLEDLGSFQAFIPTQWFSTQGTILFPRGHVPYMETICCYNSVCATSSLWVETGCLWSPYDAQDGPQSNMVIMPRLTNLVQIHPNPKGIHRQGGWKTD